MFFKDQRIGKYQILDTIGSGGFGCVYLAKDVLIDKKVAVKVPHKQGDNFEKLLREPRLLAALNHPNIVSVITAEKTNEVFYIVMEYVEGNSLEQLLRREKQLKLPRALDWFLEIGDALAYAHGKNIIHRDIRPANILISQDEHIKVADLGTSRYLENNPFASTRIGSPPYMAPEHFQGKATFQSDIYSLGVLMYECMTGKLPFFDKNPRKLAQIARETEAIPPHEHNPGIGRELSRVITKAMHRLLSSRYQSAGEVRNDLKRLRANWNQDRSLALSHLIEGETGQPKKPISLPKNFSSRDISSLFCWNCSRPVQKRTRACPHCNVTLK